MVGVELDWIFWYEMWKFFWVLDDKYKGNF